MPVTIGMGGSGGGYPNASAWDAFSAILARMPEYLEQSQARKAAKAESELKGAALEREAQRGALEREKAERKIARRKESEREFDRRKARQARPAPTPVEQFMMNKAMLDDLQSRDPFAGRAYGQAVGQQYFNMPAAAALTYGQDIFPNGFDAYASLMKAAGGVDPRMQGAFGTRAPDQAWMPPKY